MTIHEMADTVEAKIEKFDEELTKLFTRCLNMYEDKSSAPEYLQLKNFKAMYEAKKERAKTKDIMDTKGLQGVISFLPLFEKFVAQHGMQLIKIDGDDRWLRNSGIVLRFVELIPNAKPEDKKKYADHNIRLSDLYLKSIDIREEADLETAGQPPEIKKQNSKTFEPAILMMRFMRLLYLASGGPSQLAKVLAYYESEVNPKERMVTAQTPSISNPMAGGFGGMLDMFSNLANTGVQMARQSGVAGTENIPELSGDKIKETFSGVDITSLISGVGKVVSAFNSGGDIKGAFQEIMPTLQSEFGKVKTGIEALGIPVDSIPNADVHTPESIAASLPTAGTESSAPLPVE